jgi:hypothetical protein
MLFGFFLSVLFIYYTQVKYVCEKIIIAVFKKTSIAGISYAFANLLLVSFGDLQSYVLQID